MKPYQKFLLLLVAVFGTVGILIAITAPHLSNETRPSHTPSYEEVVPKDFSAPLSSRIIDVRDTSELMQPRLEINKLSRDIVSASCENQHPNCVLLTLTRWVRQNIEHKDAILQREHILSPEETIVFREGTDITMSILLISLLRAQDFDARLGHTPYVSFVETQGVRIDPGCGGCLINQTRYRGPEENIVWVS